jgi:hypothetical protein
MSDFYKERDPSGLGGDGIETDSREAFQFREGAIAFEVAIIGVNFKS